MTGRPYRRLIPPKGGIVDATSIAPGGRPCGRRAPLRTCRRHFPGCDAGAEVARDVPTGPALRSAGEVPAGERRSSQTRGSGWRPHRPAVLVVLLRRRLFVRLPAE